jgi:hypothetical protein
MSGGPEKELALHELPVGNPWRASDIGRSSGPWLWHAYTRNLLPSNRAIPGGELRDADRSLGKISVGRETDWAGHSLEVDLRDIREHRLTKFSRVGVALG